MVPFVYARSPIHNPFPESSRCATHYARLLRYCLVLALSFAHDLVRSNFPTTQYTIRVIIDRRRYMRDRMEKQVINAKEIIKQLAFKDAVYYLWSQNARSADTICSHFAHRQFSRDFPIDSHWLLLVVCVCVCVVARRIEYGFSNGSGFLYFTQYFSPRY